MSALSGLKCNKPVNVIKGWANMVLCHHPLIIKQFLIGVFFSINFDHYMFHVSYDCIYITFTGFIYFNPGTFVSDTYYVIRQFLHYTLQQSNTGISSFLVKQR